jgi:hypothetical protein
MLVAEHLVCERHGTEFAQRHGMEVDPAAEREVRRLTADETASLEAEGRHCGGPACHNPATFLFTERYTVHDEPHADEDLACDEHAGLLAVRFQVEIGLAPDEGGSR